MKIQFCGAAGEVTGSQYLLDTGTSRILLDCGMFQGHRQAALEKNRRILFASETLDAVLLSHAHIDHSGRLPLLVKSGFEGPIYSTDATRDLAGIMLPDSGRIQEDDAVFFNKLHVADGQRIEALYTEEDAYKALRQFKTMPYDQKFAVTSDIEVTLLNAGHVLGSAMIQMDIQTPSGKRRLLFTGDLGRQNMLLMKGPQAPQSVDTLLIESTYGDRIHPPVENAEEAFAAVLDRAVREGGKVLIPSFALERTQEVILILEKLRKKGRIPPIPLYVDSPMAVAITDVFNKHLGDFHLADEFKDYMASNNNPFGYGYVHYLRSSEESKSLNDKSGPMIIVAASGMCEGGRILHHLRHNIDKETTTILLVGYQAEGTLGRRLSEGQRRVKIFGFEHDVKARVQAMSFFSAHADQADLLGFIQNLKPLPRRIVLIHGDPKDRQVFDGLLASKGLHQTTTPSLGDWLALE